MLKRILDQFFWRPWDALAATVEVLGKDTSTSMKVDAAISRATHLMSRSKSQLPAPESCIASESSADTDRPSGHIYKSNHDIR